MATGTVPPAYGATSVPELLCDRPSSLSPEPPQPLLVWPEPGAATYEGSRAVFDLDLDRQDDDTWRQLARLRWFEGDPWVVDRFDVWRCGVELDALRALDECRVRAYSGIEQGYGIAPERADVGAVTLLTGDSSEELIAGECDSTACKIGEAKPSWLQAYDLAWSGDGGAHDAGAIGAMLVLGSELALDEPSNGSELSTDSLRVTWPGCGDEPLWLVLRAAELDVTRGDVLEVACRVTDDGEFTIPSGAMRLVPRGWFGELVLERISSREHVVDGGVLFAEARTRVVHELLPAR